MLKRLLIAALALISAVTLAQAQIVTSPLGAGSAVIGSNTAPTADGAIFTYQNGTKTASQIYSTIVPGGYFYYDTVRSVVDAEAGTTVTNFSAFGGYTYNNVAHGSGANAKSVVGFWADQVNAVANAATWGINTACDDSPTNNVGNAFASTCIGYEIDFTSYGGSTFQGISLLMQGPTAPASANGVQIGTVASETTSQWNYGFVVNAGAIKSGGAALNIGATSASAGPNVLSQPITMGGYDGSSAAFAMSLAAFNHGFIITDNTLSNENIVFQLGSGNQNIVVGSNSAAANLNLSAKGTGQVIVTSGIRLNGTVNMNGSIAPASKTCTVNQALTLIFTNGVLTGGTCNS